MTGDEVPTKTIIDALTLVGGAIGFLWGFIVYIMQKRRDYKLAVASDRLKRFDKFQDIQKRYDTDPSIARVLHFLHPNKRSTPEKPKEDEPTDDDKFVFMGYYEELAIMVNSGLISPDFAYWTIGLDAATIYDKEPRWHDKRTWLLFNTFARKVKERYNSIPDEEIKSLEI